MREWIWRHIRIALPDDWEMMQHGRSLASGKCLFADAQRFRLELHWRQTAKPNLDELVERQFAAFSVEPGVEEVRRLRLGDWSGVGGELEDMVISRYLQYREAEECLLEIVFLWPYKTNLEMERAVLKSIEVEAPRNGRRRWVAHGLDLMAPADMSLDACTFTPAVAQMTFSDTGGHVQEHFDFHTRAPDGMTTLRDWLILRAPGRLSVQDERQDTCSEHLITTVAGHYTKSILPWPFSHRHGYVASAWFCPHDNRLYMHTRVSDSTVDLAATWQPDHLRCCAKLRHPQLA